ncbi:MAG TPA: hypothetical protein PLN33_13600, partial [Hyphomonadaceae bacterium]|nr:hypothetical protein [Hyphomonadaceae bacterium]
MALDTLGEFAGQPVWLWIAFLSFVGFVLCVDLALINNKDGRISAKKSGLMWASFAGCALVFAAYVYFLYEPDPAFYDNPNNLNGQATLQYLTIEVVRVVVKGRVGFVE